jgi:hypothetical protein
MHVPSDKPICPLCGKPNECAAVASGSFDAECWCKSVTFSADLLASVPENDKRMACICPRCAQAGGRVRIDERAGG